MSKEFGKKSSVSVLRCEEFLDDEAIAVPLDMTSSLPVAPSSLVNAEVLGRVGDRPATCTPLGQHALREGYGNRERVVPQESQDGGHGLNRCFRMALFPVEDRPRVDP